MGNVNYAYIANSLLGDELYCKFIKEMSKGNKNSNLVDFGKKIFEKCCLLLVSIGMSNTIKMSKIEICIGNEIIEVSCKEFAEKYNKYINEIENNIKTVEE